MSKLDEVVALLAPIKASVEHPGFILVVHNTAVYSFGNIDGPYGYDVTYVDGKIHTGAKTIPASATAKELAAFIRRTVRAK